MNQDLNKAYCAPCKDFFPRGHASKAHPPKSFICAHSYVKEGKCEICGKVIIGAKIEKIV